MGASPSVAFPDSCLANKTSNSQHRGLHSPAVSLTELQVTSCPKRLTGASCLGTQDPSVAPMKPVKAILQGHGLLLQLQLSIEFLDNDVNASVPTCTSMLALLKSRTIFVYAPRRTIQHGYPGTLFVFLLLPLSPASWLPTLRAFFDSVRLCDMGELLTTSIGSTNSWSLSPPSVQLAAGPLPLRRMMRIDLCCSSQVIRACVVWSDAVPFLFSFSPYPEQLS